MNDDPYVYPKTEVLRNKLDLHDKGTLKEAETVITTLRITRLRQNAISSEFNLETMKQIHKFIFDPLYAWAGNIRSISIEKGYSNFCPVEKIEQRQAELFNLLKKENYLQNLSVDDFAERITYYFGEINMLHPFREGNGRTQREFIYQLSKAAGHELDLTNITQEQMLKATFDYSNHNNYEMRKMIYKELFHYENDLVADAAIEKHDRLKRILSIDPPPEPLKYRNYKNPDICNEYCNLAKKIIFENDGWPGAIADCIITKKLLEVNYPKYKIQNILRSTSLETAGMSDAMAQQYAKRKTQEISKTISKGIER